MTLAIFAKTFTRPTLEATLDAVVAHGLHCVQFNLACAGVPSMPDDIEPTLAEKIRRELDARQITMAAVSGTFNMIHPDKRQPPDGIRRLRVLASVCGTLGTSVITLCTGTRDEENMWRHHADNDLPDAWLDLTGAMSRALRIAEEFNLILGLEPETANVVDSARKARRLLDEMKSPRLKIIIDPANLLRPGDLPRQRDVLDEAFDLLGYDLVLAHAKELGPDLHPDGRGPGRGVLDWQHFLSLLQQARFAGALVMHGLEEKEVAASAAFLRGKLLAIEGSPR